jgi:hypothetical protein
VKRTGSTIANLTLFTTELAENINGNGDPDGYQIQPPMPGGQKKPENDIETCQNR